MVKKRKILKYITRNKLHFSNVENNNKILNNNTKKQIFKFKNKIILWNTTIIVKNLIRTSQIVANFNKKKETILFIGNSPFLKLVSIIFQKKKNHIFLISNWLPGLLTNWEKTQTFLNSDFLLFAKKSKKLRFLKTFANIKKKKKPSIVIVYSNATIDSVISKECFINNIPIVFLITNNVPKNASYSICSNNQNINAQWFFIQLFLNL